MVGSFVSSLTTGFVSTLFDQRAYELFRSLGLRFLPVVNCHNQVVGSITRADLSPEGLARTLLTKGKKHI